MMGVKLRIIECIIIDRISSYIMRYKCRRTGVLGRHSESVARIRASRTSGRARSVCRGNNTEVFVRRRVQTLYYPITIM